MISMRANTHVFVCWAGLLVFVGIGVALIEHRGYERLVIRALQNQRQYYEFRYGGDPVQCGLLSSRYGPGTSVETLLAEHTPKRIVCHDEYVTIWYMPNPRVLESTQVVARDGKLVFACHSGFCSYSGYLFFNSLSEDELRAWDDSLENSRRQSRLRTWAASHSVGGTAAVAHYQFPPPQVPIPEERP